MRHSTLKTKISFNRQYFYPKSNFVTQTLPLIKLKTVEILYQNELKEMVIFKIENMEDISWIQDLSSIEGVEVTPDLKFSRLKKI